MKQNNNTERSLNARATVLKDKCITIYNYRDQKIKNILLKIKKDKDFIKSTEAKGVIVQLLNQIHRLCNDIIQENTELDSSSNTPSNTPSIQKALIINIPSTSYWMSKKSFDHMHILTRQIVKMNEINEVNANNRANNSKDFNNVLKIIHLAHAIVPRVVKGSQKKLTKEQRIFQSNNAYKLSWGFKKLLQNIDCHIIILDDIHTTGSTIKSCRQTIEDYLNEIYKTHIKIISLTIAYEP